MTQDLSAADRIRDLNSINEDVSLMLRSAGLAINTLTGRPVDTSNGNDAEMTDGPTSVDSAKELFQTHVTDYYTKLQAVIARLRRQAYALEEAGIISAEAAALSSNGPAPRMDASSTRGGLAGTTSSDPGRITNGGLGNLDVGWLNSRGNKVATEKEKEIMNDMKELLQKVLSEGEEKQTESAG